jgi:hypothetical protein
MGEQITSEEAEYLLRSIIADEQRRLHLLLMPYTVALSEIESRKPPRPVTLPDGRAMMYVGPTAESIAGVYKTPEWLSSMVRQDMMMSDRLRRYRDKNL